MRFKSNSECSDCLKREWWMDTTCHFHSTCTPLDGCGRISWFVGSFLQPCSLFPLVGVVCLCGGVTLDCKWQSKSCFQLPMEA